MKLTVQQVLEHYSDYLSHHGDISLMEEISQNSKLNAIRSYSISDTVSPSDILLMVDNRFGEPGEQGLILTADSVFAYSEIAGKISLDFDEIFHISPQIRYAEGIPIPGLLFNRRRFSSLPGLHQIVEFQGDELPILSFLATIITVFSPNCEKVDHSPEDDPGPPPWFDLSFHESVPVRKEASNEDTLLPSFGGRTCSVGMGFFGTKTCNYPPSKICPRCYQPVCSTHTVTWRTYGGESICEPCARGMSDDSA
jgi:hypothetical protein